MAFLNVSEMDIIMWNQIDPHFGDPKEKRTKTQAPSPAARFPASDEGWRDAIAYVRQKQPSVKRGGMSMSNHICTADDCCTYEERQQQRRGK